MHTDTRPAMLAALFAGLMFGMFWIPLRELEQTGLEGPWAVALFSGLPTLCCVPLMIRNRHMYRVRFARSLVGGLLGGLAFAFYSLSFIYTDVIRAVLLFYTTPIWGFLLGWLWLGDRMTAERWLAIGIGIVGLMVIFGLENGLPLPRNIGDWLGLASGLLWAIAALLILTDNRVGAVTHTINFLAVSTLVALAAAVILTQDNSIALPSSAAVTGALWWLIPVTVLITLPASFATLYGPTKLNPGVVGLLFMTEVSVATVTAAWLTDEPFGTREIVGVTLISLAGLIEPLMRFRKIRT